MSTSRNLLLPLTLALAAYAAPGLAQSSDSQELSVFSARPLDGYHVTVADFAASAVLSGAAAQVPKPDPLEVTSRSVGARLSAKDAAQDALTLSWKDTRYASLRVEGGEPVDLRPYLAQGVLAFDLDVREMAHGGLSFKIDCGNGCSRAVSYLVPARAQAGKGWQHVVFSMSCFVHDGDNFGAVPQPFVLDTTGTGEVSVANIKFLKTGTPNASCPDYKTASVTPAMQSETWSIDWWLPRHLMKLDEVKSKPDAKLVFIGDSITQGWEKSGQSVFDRYYKKYNAVALGFGGDCTENVLWRLQHGEVDGIAPKVAVLMVGTNNTGHRQEDPKLVAAGVQRNIEELQHRLPHTKILLLGIFPRDQQPDGAYRQHNDKVNALLAGFADNKKVFFLNINKDFLDANGVLSKAVMPDLLHPNEQGYEIWAQAMQPTLLQLLK